MQAHNEMESVLKEKVDILNHLNEGIQVLHVEIDEKSIRKEELCRLYEEKKKEVE